MRALILISLLWAGQSFANERFIEKGYLCNRLNQSSIELADQLESEYMQASDPTKAEVIFARIEDRKAMLDELCRGYANEARLRLSQLETLLYETGYKKVYFVEISN